MSESLSLWGTYSVADHLRKRPFVADVLLYDLLVVPTPESPAEEDRWRSLGRDPDTQARLLKIIDKQALHVPWTVGRAGEWAQRYGTKQGPAVRSAVRDDVAQGVSSDVAVIEQARRATAAPPGGQINPDDFVYSTTRQVLVDEYGSMNDRALVAGVPRVDDVQVVVAYGSYREFSDDRGRVQTDPIPGEQPVFTFSWSFFVPANSDRTDDDLLREAVELAHADEISDWRSAVQRWRRDSVRKGQSDADALKDLEDLIKDYKQAARKRTIQVRLQWASIVAAAVGGAAAVVVPPVGVSALFGLAALRSPRPIPKNLEAAALFYTARRRFR
jgi:hypothetical protein